LNGTVELLVSELAETGKIALLDHAHWECEDFSNIGYPVRRVDGV
jgi:hypothetical protein